ncbi:NAD(P)H-dependent flavin oxidoreductase YrpB, nitropropane dioxygenase family [Arboricoccus pini]|uniref:NAD(P)H-dependent flavin oxidoreductase YrpB, nitropropane dioxygenase family n=1 Tax=Arboricoccus pini TaxID=1963835 RepID=A0A212PYT3_9PROT|nr:nitronate monooxygenase [Arboricoccus pini]SNB52124.1 NAD(P)H-dependent flavin oxidoreductase YrpB, nitropropane dioxygenase family [Arboricoccus pini]
MSCVQPMVISGAEVWPLVEGGKGVAVSDGRSAGAWAAAGGVGTFSGVNADVVDANGEYVPLIFKGRDRRERHEELIDYSIRGAISQARIAHETRRGEGRIHINVLWEMGSCERVLTSVLDGAKDLIHGVTCGAGMPYRLAEICERYGIHYYPIVSSGRAFNALWKRAYHKAAELLGAVVYEDPWRAGGHNGLSNVEDPKAPQSPLPRVLELRRLMRSFGLGHVPIVMAGGVWHLKDWKDWIGNPELGPIAFQFGTRPLLTQESPIPDSWKQRIANLLPGDVLLHKFSPTGFYSSAVRNDFLNELVERSDRQVEIAEVADPASGKDAFFAYGRSGSGVFMRADDLARVQAWQSEGFTQPMRTPDSTMIFVTPERARNIRRDQAGCMGCLSHCSFSNWKDHDDMTTGRMADPRSFCIQKTLQDIAHGEGDPVDNQLMFSGHNVYQFKQDPFYANGFIPSVKQLVQRILTGN